MIKHSFKTSDLVNPQYTALAVEMGKIVREVNKEINLPDAVLLEEFGTTLQQQAWQDVTGYYITFRPHPMYSHQERVARALKMVEERFIKQFKVDPRYTPQAAAHEAGDPNSKITVSVVTDSFSIGD